MKYKELKKIIEKEVILDVCERKDKDCISDDRFLYVRDNITEKEIKKLSKEISPYLREFAAYNTTDVETINRLSDDVVDLVRELVAKNKFVTQKVLKKLAVSDNDNIRKAVFENQNSDDDIKKVVKKTTEGKLERLANSDDKEYRLKAAVNENTPAHVLEKLSEDVNLNVKQHVAKNPNTPNETLKKLAVGGINVRTWVLKNPNVSNEVIEIVENTERLFKYFK